MKFSPRNVRSRLTLWYVVALGVILASYAAVALVFLFLGLRQQLDHTLHEDKETIEGQIRVQPDGSLAVRLHHEEEDDPDFQRFVEIWSLDGKLIYRTPQLGGQSLGPTPSSRAAARPLYSMQLPTGLRLRVLESLHHIGNGAIILRVAHNEAGMWEELREVATILAVVFPLAVMLAGLGGYALARKALAPVDAMTRETERISAEELDARLSVANPEDELGRLALVINAMLGRLQLAFSQLRRFTADASHELRTPLTAIRSVGEVALQLPKTPAEYRDVIGSMLEEVDCLTRLVENLLILSRADASRVHLQSADISLLSVASEAASVLEVLAEEKGQQIGVEGQATLIVNADRLILRQAIVNLLDNAIKYSPGKTRILVRATRDGANQAYLDVIDEGPGIPTEHQPYIFDRFYRVDKARSREWGGAGLGLAITRWAVEAHGGQISLNSREGEGSTFRITLPLSPNTKTS